MPLPEPEESMANLIARDEKYRKLLKAVQIVYGLTGIALAVNGILHKSLYDSLLPLATLLLIPGLPLVRRLFGWKGGWQLETYIYLFSYLGWSLGGAASVYVLVPGYDKVIHCLSGVFVGIMALAFYEMLERRHSKEGANPATGCFFVFFASMAVAGLFELGEYVVSPLIGRDLQNVGRTGVGDTMGDMFVCLLGTLVVNFLMIRSIRGKHDPLTDAVRVFALQNTPRDRSNVSSAAISSKSSNLKAPLGFRN